ncbi:MAG: hypothetical protein AAGH64_11720 [Planctomycetota bacterium]
MQDRVDNPQPAEPFVLEQWDDAPLVREIFVLNNLVMRTSERFVTDIGLTSSRWLLLGAIDDAEQTGDAPTVSSLSQNALLLSVQNVSRMLASVEEEGLVERFNVPGRGRSVFVRLTDEGRATLHRACSRASLFIERLLDGLTGEDIARVRGNLTHLVANLNTLSNDLNAGRIDVTATDHANGGTP